MIVEAERMALSGGFSVQDDLILGYSFGGYITYDDDDSLAEFDVTSVSGIGVLQIRFYSLAHNFDMEVVVNGVSHTVTFNHPGHGGWDHIYLEVEFFDDMTAMNRVQLKPITQETWGAYPLIDRIVVQEACASSSQGNPYIL